MLDSAATERFWAKVNVCGPDECWEWTAGKFTAGYGGFGFEGKTRYAHRVSYELANGAIPDGVHLLHSCDNPACVNPSHLSLGTHKTNIRDAANKGRWMSEKRKAHLARLHESQVTHGKSRRDARGYRRGLMEAADIVEGSVDESGAIMDPYELVRRLRRMAEDLPAPSKEG